MMQRLKKLKITDSERLYTVDEKEVTLAVNNGLTVIIPGDGLVVIRAVEDLVKNMSSYYYRVYEKIGGRLKYYGYAIPK